MHENGLLQFFEAARFLLVLRYKLTLTHQTKYF
jgi:hypothetical protein